MIEHEAEVLRDADRLVLFREGEIIADGAPHELMTGSICSRNAECIRPDLNQVLAMLGDRAPMPRTWTKPKR